MEEYHETDSMKMVKMMRGEEKVMMLLMLKVKMKSMMKKDEEG